MDQLARSTQVHYAQAADAARNTAASLEGWFRNQIEAQPYVTAAVAAWPEPTVRFGCIGLPDETRFAYRRGQRLIRLPA